MKGNKPSSIRVDIWLWQTRFFKSRSMAQKYIRLGCRLNSKKIYKPSSLLTIGDVIVFSREKNTYALRVLELGDSRKSFEEAKLLYEKL